MLSFISLVDMHLVEIKVEAQLKLLLCCACRAPQVIHRNAWENKVFLSLNKAKVKDQFSKRLHYKHNIYFYETLRIEGNAQTIWEEINVRIMRLEEELVKRKKEMWSVNKEK